MAGQAIRIAILANARAAIGQIRAVDKSLTGLGKSSSGLAKAGLFAVGGGIAAGLGAAVKSAADFEQRISGIKAVTGATSKEMTKLTNKALEIGKKTKFSASQGAQAIEELAKAGISTADIMNGAADATVNLAAAGEVDLPQAATIAANALNQFNLQGSDTAMIADQIAGAANASAIDVSQFGMSLSQAGATASLVGLSFADTATAIAELGNAGIVGSDAGTSLKTMLTRLVPAAKPARDAMRLSTPPEP